MDLGSGLDDCKGLALAALAALEMDKLDRVVELANRISGPLQENGFCDYLLGTVLARQGEHEHALQIALSLYGVDVSRRSGERLRSETLQLMQGRGGSRDGVALIDQALQAAPVGIDPLEQLSHASPSSPLTAEADWQDLFRFWCELIGEGKADELGRLGLAKLDQLVDLTGSQAQGLRAAQDSMGYDAANSFGFVYYLLALRGVESLPAPIGVVGAKDDRAVDVSIILPVYNKWNITLNCLRSLAVARLGAAGFEVILADDASTDDTSKIAECNPWVRQIRHERNSGFVDNCNNAAAYARGDILIFLNNDTLVGDGWLVRLLGSFRRRPGAGVVGSQVYASDGGLLESGGILWGNGDVWNHGRGFDSQRWFELDHEREVDYVSGCAMAIRRELWQCLGGFDVRFRPAYCEDADFCLRAREAGQAVIVQPQSRILHLEGLSNARSTDAGLKRYQLTNLGQLRKRWSRLLLTEQPIDMSRQLLASDRGLRRGPVALIVDHYFPTPDRDAGSRCTLSLVSSLLALGFKVIFIPDNFASFEPYRRRLEEWGVLCLWGDEMSMRWYEWLEKQIPKVDLILYNRPHVADRFLAPLCRLYPEAFRLYNIHDLHGLRQRLEVEHADGLPASLSSLSISPTTLAELCTEQELRILPQMQGIITLSEKETNLLRRHFPSIVHTVPGYIMRWRGHGASRDFAAEKLLFVGGFAHKPNRLGLEWFLQTVWPHLPERVQLIVVGSNCPPELESRLMSTSRVLYAGSVNDQRLAELYASTRISLAPLPYGAGLKGKVIEALSWGHRVLGSEYAFEGLDHQPYAAPVIAIRCCRSAEEYVAAVTEALAMDPAEGSQLDAACKDFIERCFSREAQQHALKALLPDALSQKQRPASVDTMPWPDAVRGGAQRGVKLLSSSYGLCSDGWLESSNQLALELTPGVTELWLGFYIPDLAEIDGKAALELELGDGQEILMRGRLAIQSGETRTTLSLPGGVTHLATLSVCSFYSYQPSDQGDVRQLVAVLSELQAR